MPVQKSKSGLASKLGSRGAQAYLDSRDNEVKYDTGGRLPPGIEGGIAQLVECKFTEVAEGKQNAGEPMFYAAGTIISPEEHNGIKIKGLRTSIMEIITDTPSRSRKTVEDHLAWVQNEMKKLDPNCLDDTGLDDLENVAASLKEAAPYFRFRTWAGSKRIIKQKPNGKWTCCDEDGKNPQGEWSTEEKAKAANPYAGKEPLVNEVWGGACEYILSEDETSGTEDSTIEAPAEETEAETEAEAETEEAETEAEEEEKSEAAELAEAADGGDKAAVKKFRQKALDAGITDEDIDNAESYTALVEQIDNPSEEEEAEEETKEESVEPKVGDVVNYKAPGKKKAAEYKIVSIVRDKKLANLKSLDDGKVAKGVPWAQLED